MKIGYARVSTHDQNFDLQIDALKKEGCQKIFKEKASGAKAERKELSRLLEHIRDGDIVVIWKLDRLGRSLKNLVELVSLLKYLPPAEEFNACLCPCRVIRGFVETIFRQLRASAGNRVVRLVPRGGHRRRNLR